jgi:outer membrane protein
MKVPVSTLALAAGALAAAALLGLGAAAARAADDAAAAKTAAAPGTDTRPLSARLTPDDITRLLAGPSEERPLGAAEAVRGTLDANPGLVAYRLSELRARESLAGAKAALYLPSVSGSIGYDLSSSIATSTLSMVDVIDSKSFHWTVGLSEPLPSGGTVSLSSSDARYFTNDEALLPELRTSFGASVTVAVSQPLLRGCCIKPPRAGVLLAGDDLRYARLVLQRALNQVAADVLNAYWDLAFAHRDLELKRAAIANLDARAAWTERSIAEGRIAKTDAIQVATSRAAAVADYLAAVNSLLDAEEHLKTLIGLKDAGPGTRTRPLPKDDPPAPAGAPPAPDDVYAAAAARNYDLLVLRAELGRKKLERVLARDAFWPSLDLWAGYTFRGTGADRGAELMDLADPGTKSWGVGLSFSYPLFDTPSKAAARAADHALRAKETELAYVERALHEEVDRVVRAVVALRTTMELLGDRRALAEKTLAAEEEKFAVGRSTLKDLLDFQEGLERARVAEAHARYDLAKGLVALDRVQGTLVGVVGVTTAGSEGG